MVDEGARLVFIIDPLKPFKSTTAGIADQRGGFYSIVQMIKALVSTRFEASLKAISERYPDVDFLVFQPDEECAKLMSGSPLRTRFRVEIIESAFCGTLRKLRERHHVYDAKMNRYGFQLHSEEKLREIEGSYSDILNAHGAGDLIKRYKRFLADVTLDDGTEITAHCPNTGSMKTCGSAGDRVVLSHHDNPKRKLAYSWEYTCVDDGYIGINTMRPNQVVGEALSNQEVALSSCFRSGPKRG